MPAVTVSAEGMEAEKFEDGGGVEMLSWVMIKCRHIILISFECLQEFMK